MINNFTLQKHVDMSYFLAFGDLNGDWLRKKPKRNTQLSAPFVALNCRDWLSRSANGVLLKTSVVVLKSQVVFLPVCVNVKNPTRRSLRRNISICLNFRELQLLPVLILMPLRRRIVVFEWRFT